MLALGAMTVGACGSESVSPDFIATSLESIPSDSGELGGLDLSDVSCSSGGAADISCESAEGAEIAVRVDGDCFEAYPADRAEATAGVRYFGCASP